MDDKVTEYSNINTVLFLSYFPMTDLDKYSKVIVQHIIDNLISIKNTIANIFKKQELNINTKYFCHLIKTIINFLYEGQIFIIDFLPYGTIKILINEGKYFSENFEYIYKFYNRKRSDDLKIVEKKTNEPNTITFDEICKKIITLIYNTAATTRTPIINTIKTNNSLRDEYISFEIGLLFSKDDPHYNNVKVPVKKSIKSYDFINFDALSFNELILGLYNSLKNVSENILNIKQFLIYIIKNIEIYHNTFNFIILYYDYILTYIDNNFKFINNDNKLVISEFRSTLIQILNENYRFKLYRKNFDYVIIYEPVINNVESTEYKDIYFPIDFNDEYINVLLEDYNRSQYLTTKDKNKTIDKICINICNLLNNKHTLKSKRNLQIYIVLKELFIIFMYIPNNHIFKFNFDDKFIEIYNINNVNIINSNFLATKDSKTFLWYEIDAFLKNIVYVRNVLKFQYTFEIDSNDRSVYVISYREPEDEKEKRIIHELQNICNLLIKALNDKSVNINTYIDRCVNILVDISKIIYKTIILTIKCSFINFLIEYEYKNNELTLNIMTDNNKIEKIKFDSDILIKYLKEKYTKLQDVTFIYSYNENDKNFIIICSDISQPVIVQTVIEKEKDSDNDNYIPSMDFTDFFKISNKNFGTSTITAEDKEKLTFKKKMSDIINIITNIKYDIKKIDDIAEIITDNLLLIFNIIKNTYIFNFGIYYEKKHKLIIQIIYEDYIKYIKIYDTTENIYRSFDSKFIENFIINQFRDKVINRFEYNYYSEKNIFSLVAVKDDSTFITPIDKHFIQYENEINDHNRHIAYECQDLCDKMNILAKITFSFFLVKLSKLIDLIKRNYKLIITILNLDGFKIIYDSATSEIYYNNIKHPANKTSLGAEFKEFFYIKNGNIYANCNYVYRYSGDNKEKTFYIEGSYDDKSKKIWVQSFVQNPITLINTAQKLNVIEQDRECYKIINLLLQSNFEKNIDSILTFFVYMWNNLPANFTFVFDSSWTKIGSIEFQSNDKKRIKIDNVYREVTNAITNEYFRSIVTPNIPFYNCLNFTYYLNELNYTFRINGIFDKNDKRLPQNISDDIFADDKKFQKLVETINTFDQREALSIPLINIPQVQQSSEITSNTSRLIQNITSRLSAKTPVVRITEICQNIISNMNKAGKSDSISSLIGEIYNIIQNGYTFKFDINRKCQYIITHIDNNKKIYLCGQNKQTSEIKGFNIGSIKDNILKNINDFKGEYELEIEEKLFYIKKKNTTDSKITKSIVRPKK